MKFSGDKKAHKILFSLGYLAIYLVFSTIFYWLLRLTNRISDDTNIVYVYAGVAIVIVLIKLLKRVVGN